MKKRLLILGVITLAMLMQSGCTHVDGGATIKKVGKQARFVILPMENLAETPRANERVESMLQSLMHSKGIRNLAAAPKATGEEVDLALLLDDGKRLETAKDWALKKGFRYGITGSIQEWRYKTGLDGEPAVGITLKLIDLENKDALLWTATASRTGWGSENLTGTTADVLKTLISKMEFLP